MVFKNLFGKKEGKQVEAKKAEMEQACQVTCLYDALRELYPGDESVHTVLLDKKQKARIVFSAFTERNQKTIQIHLRKWKNGTR